MARLTYIMRFCVKKTKKVELGIGELVKQLPCKKSLGDLSSS